MSGQLHEHFERPELPLPPERSTGLVFAAMAAAVAYFGRSYPALVATGLGTAIALVVISFTVPHILRPLNILWMRFAILLSKIFNPIVMMILFAIVIVPAGLLMQLVRDPLRRKRGVGSSYWLPVAFAERSSQSNMKNQF